MVVGKVPWLLGEGQQLPWLLWQADYPVITKTMFAIWISHKGQSHQEMSCLLALPTKAWILCLDSL
jgi:hypothetical protein